VADLLIGCLAITGMTLFALEGYVSQFQFAILLYAMGEHVVAVAFTAPRAKKLMRISVQLSKMY
jgi:hypothetical protein